MVCSDFPYLIFVNQLRSTQPVLRENTLYIYVCNDAYANAFYMYEKGIVFFIADNYWIISC